MSTRSITTSREKTIAWGSIIPIGIIHIGALFAFLPSFFSWQALALCVILHWLTGGIGICLTYHRLLTHRSFAVRPSWLKYVLTGIGCAACEGGPLGWVADHRRHHAHSDEEGDAHTPHEGFAWAHMFWWITPEVETLHDEEYYKRWVPDLMKDRVLVWMDKWNGLFPIGLAVILFAIGGWPFVVWGVCVRTVLVLHATWLVNSATHVWGYRSYKTRDDSTNLWWVALITYGEGWHNNHHAFATSARHGLKWWEFDMTFLMIRLMSFVGMATDIKLPKESQLEAAAISNGNDEAPTDHSDQSADGREPEPTPAVSEPESDDAPAEEAGVSDVGGPVESPQPAAALATSRA